MLTSTATVTQFLDSSSTGTATAVFTILVEDGRITPADWAARTQRVYVAGVEQAIYPEIRSTYPSGNVRVFGGEFACGLDLTTPRVGEVRFDLGARATTDLTTKVYGGSFDDPTTHLPIYGSTTAAGVVDLGRPPAMCLQSSAADLCGSGAFGVLATKAQALAIPGLTTEMAQWYGWADTYLAGYHWNGAASDALTLINTDNPAHSSALTGGEGLQFTTAARPPAYQNWRSSIGSSGFSGGQNYYDAAMICFLLWMQTADVAWFKKACVYAWTYQYNARYIINIVNNNDPIVVVSNNFDLITTSGIDYWISGTKYSVASGVVFDTGTTATIAATKWGIALLSLSTVGAPTLTWATNGGTGYADEATAIAALPATPAGQAAIGYVTVQAGASTWTAGTCALVGGTGGTPAVGGRWVSQNPPYYKVTPWAVQTGAYQPEGLGMHAILVGSLDSFQAIEGFANNEQTTTLGTFNQFVGSALSEPRPMGRILLARLWAKLAGSTVHDWTAQMQALISDLSTGPGWQHDGAGKYYWNNNGNDEACSTGTMAANGCHLFMQMIVDDALHKVRELGGVDAPTIALIDDLTVKNLDYCLNHFYFSDPTGHIDSDGHAQTRPGFVYKSGDCVNLATAGLPVDLANDFPAAYAYAGWRYGRSDLTTFSATQFHTATAGTADNSPDGPFLSGQKQSREEFALSLRFPGYYLQATATGGTATHLALSVQPAGAVSGAVLTQQPVVQIVGSGGGVYTGYNGRVKALLVGGNAQIIGDVVYAINGVATYTTLRLDGSGPQLLGFFAVDMPELGGVTSGVINMPIPPGGSSFNRGRRRGGRGR